MRLAARMACRPLVMFISRTLGTPGRAGASTVAGGKRFSFQQRGAVHQAEVGRLMACWGIRPQLNTPYSVFGGVVDDGCARGCRRHHQQLARGFVEHQRGRHGRARALTGLHAVGNGLALGVGGAKLKSVSSLLSRKPPLRAAVVVTICRAPNWSSMVVVMPPRCQRHRRC